MKINFQKLGTLILGCSLVIGTLTSRSALAQQVSAGTIATATANSLQTAQTSYNTGAQLVQIANGITDASTRGLVMAQANVNFRNSYYAASAGIDAAKYGAILFYTSENNITGGLYGSLLNYAYAASAAAGISMTDGPTSGEPNQNGAYAIQHYPFLADYYDVYGDGVNNRRILNLGQW